MLFCTVAGIAHGQAPDQYTFPSRRKLIADSCPSVKLLMFEFGNSRYENADHHQAGFTWQNKTKQDVVAVEIVVLRYDPFNRPMIGERTTFAGKMDPKKDPLKPNEKETDGTDELGFDDTFTGIAYVSSVRFADGTVWMADQDDVAKKVKALVPEIAILGKLYPDASRPMKLMIG